MVFHLSRYNFEQSFQYDIVGISLVSALAIVAGVYMLLRRNWARWLALAWMAFHVIISYFNGWQKMAVHAVFLAVIGYFLMRRSAEEYFSDKYPTQPKEG